MKENIEKKYRHDGLYHAYYDWGRYNNLTIEILDKIVDHYMKTLNMKLSYWALVYTCYLNEQTIDEFEESIKWSDNLDTYYYVVLNKSERCLTIIYRNFTFNIVQDF